MTFVGIERIVPNKVKTNINDFYSELNNLINTNHNITPVQKALLLGCKTLEDLINYHIETINLHEKALEKRDEELENAL